MSTDRLLVVLESGLVGGRALGGRRAPLPVPSASRTVTSVAPSCSAPATSWARTASTSSGKMSAVIAERSPSRRARSSAASRAGASCPTWATRCSASMATGMVASSSVGMATTRTLSASSGAWSGNDDGEGAQGDRADRPEAASPLRPNQRAASRNGSMSRTSANDRGGRPAKAIDAEHDDGVGDRAGRGERRAPSLARAGGPAGEDGEEHEDRRGGDRERQHDLALELAAVGRAVARPPSRSRATATSRIWRRARSATDRPRLRRSSRRAAGRAWSRRGASRQAFEEVDGPALGGDALRGQPLEDQPVQCLRQQPASRTATPVGAAAAGTAEEHLGRVHPAVRRPTGRRPGRTSGVPGRGRRAAPPRSRPGARPGPPRTTATAGPPRERPARRRPGCSRRAGTRCRGRRWHRPGCGRCRRAAARRCGAGRARRRPARRGPRCWGRARRRRPAGSSPRRRGSRAAPWSRWSPGSASSR